jgi:exopolysaccharide biosynthesis polyprenyl glycosylphosphotransferase
MPLLYVFMKRSELAFTLALVPLDYLALVAAGIAAYYSRFHPYFTTIRPVIFTLTLQQYLTILLPSLCIWIGVFAFAGLYSTHRRSIARELSRVTLATSSSMALVFSLLFFSRTFFDSRFIALVAWFFSIVFVSLGRLAIRGVQRSLMSMGIGVHRIALIGSNDTAETLKTLFEQKPRFGLQIVSIFKSFDASTAKKLKQLRDQDKIDEILLADPEASKEMTLALIAFTDVEHLGFRYSADLFATAVGRSVIHMFSGIPVIEVQKTPLDGWGAIYKRLFDIFASLILIILTSPIMLLTAIAIKLDSRGPIFFSRLDDNKHVERIGQGGKPFPYFKFRSMVPGTHNMRYKELSEKDTRKGTPMVKIANDPRITRVGAFIRKFSIDELPEFFLVLTGKMSLVGPRPHLPEEVAKYKPEHRKVLTIKPGITGLAQISGRADLDFDEEVRLDVYYIEHWSPWMDLYILLKTPIVVLFRKGAY